MKKRFCRASTVAGLLAGSLFVNAQSGGGGGAGAGGAGGGAAGSGSAAGGGISGAGGISGRAGGVSGQSAAGVNANAPGVGQPGASVGVNPRGGTINSIGAAGINQPSGSTPIGGGSVIESSPNTVGGSSITGLNPGAPAGQGTVGTLPGSGVLPPGSAARQAQPGDVGQPVLQNGTLQGGVAAGTAAANAAAANPAIANAQAGIPLTSLPANLQQTIQQRLGGAQVQTISRDDLANGSVYRVTTLQNGTPTELRFGANGAFLGSTVLPGTATSFVTPAVGGVVLDTLPVPVQSTIRGQAGSGRISNIVPQGQGWVVTYDANGQPTTMLVGPDGRILRAGPTANTATGSAAPAATGGGASTNSPSNTTTNGQRTSSVDLDELPDEVRSSLGQEIGAADVQFVRREQRPIGDVYVVGARTPDQYVQLTVDSSGKVIRDSRDVPVVTIGPAAPRRAESDQATGIPIYRVPVAVQNAVKAYATASDIRSVNLGQDQGRAVYDVVFMRGAHRDRMIVAKDGTLVRMERNVAPALDNSAAGARLAIGDLPSEVRETILQQTEQVLVKDVSTKRLGDQTVYSVRYETNGAPVELMVASDGTVVIPETSPDADVPNSPRPAPLDPDAPTPVRVVDNVAASVAPADGSLAAAGRAAATETSVADSATPAEEAAAESAGAEPAQKVTLSDVPLPVQTSATKLAGNGVIESITPKLGDNGIIYEVKISEDGQQRTLRLNKDGAVRQNE